MAGENAKRLGELVELVRGTTYSSSRLGDPGPVLLGLASIHRNGGFRSENLKSYGGPTAANLLLRPSDLYVSLKDVTQSADLLGSIARVPAEVPLGRLTQDTVKLTLKPGTHPGLIYWTLRTPQYRAYCRAHATGTTNLGLPRDDFLAFPIPGPTPDRMALVALLENLDSKIELNRRIAETLETMARALFESWFVDFAPVRAKLEGRPTGLPDDVAALFPDRLGDNGLPEGWSRTPLLDHARLISGGTPKTSEPTYWDGGLLWASAKDVSQCPDSFLVSTERTITQRGLEESATRLVPKFSTVVVARGATTGRHCLFGREMAMNQTCYALSSVEGAPFWLACSFNHLVDELVQGAHGSVFNTITTSTLDTARVTTASPEVVLAFEDTVKPIYFRILSAIEENACIKGLRDTLLPKLISGELRITDAGAQVSAA